MPRPDACYLANRDAHLLRPPRRLTKSRNGSSMSLKLIMRRREFIALLSGAAVGWARAGHTQQAGNLPLIGFLGAGSLASWHRDVDAFDHRLRELGWIDGRTVTVEYRWAEGHSERYAAIAAEFVRQKVDVIVTSEALYRPPSSKQPRYRSYSQLRPIRLERGWSQVSLIPTSPACLFNRLILPQSALNFCGKLFLAFADWRSWAMSAIPLPYLRWPMSSLARAKLALMLKD